MLVGVHVRHLDTSALERQACTSAEKQFSIHVSAALWLIPLRFQSADFVNLSLLSLCLLALTSQYAYRLLQALLS